MCRNSFRRLIFIPELIKALTDDEWAFPEGVTDKAEDLMRDLLLEMVQYQLPEEHFLKQEFYVNIMLDTGDGNYDFTLNSPYPCWYGDYKARLHESKCSITTRLGSRGRKWDNTPKT